MVYSSFSTCDIADMVKTYFRELPEVLLTNKLSEMFIAIFQCKYVLFFIDVSVGIFYLYKTSQMNPFYFYFIHKSTCDLMRQVFHIHLVTEHYTTHYTLYTTHYTLHTHTHTHTEGLFHPPIQFYTNTYLEI